MDGTETGGVQSSSQTSSTAPTSSASTPSAGGENWNTNTTISSMEDLRKKAPKVYEAMMQGLGMNMVSKMRRNQEHLKQIMREGNRVFER